MNLSVKLTQFGKEEAHIVEVGVNGNYKISTITGKSDVESLFNEFVTVASANFKEVATDLKLIKKVQAKESGFIAFEEPKQRKNKKK